MTRPRHPAEASTTGWPRLVVAGIRSFYLSLILWLLVWTAGAVMVFGLDPVLIVSGSMAPAIRAGDVVLASAPQPDRLVEGVVVTYVDPAMADRLVTHRIEAVLDDGRLRTRGDANAAADSTPVDVDAVVGEGRVLVPMLGLPVLWLRRGQTVWFGAWAALTLLALVAPGTGAGRVRGAEADSTSATEPVTRSANPPPLPIARPGALWHARQPPWAPTAPRQRGGVMVPLRAAAVAGVMVLGVVVPAAPVEAWGATATNEDNLWSAATIAAPTDLSATGGCQLLVADPKVDLSWTAVTADGYRILRSDTAGGPYTQVGTVTDGATTTFTDTDVSGSSTYYYVVQATAGSWSSAFSAEASASTPLCP